MKRYKISKFYIGIYSVCLICFLGFLIFIVDCIRKWGFDWATVVCLFVGIVSLIAGIYSVLFDFQFGSFTINSEGITMYVGLRKYRHIWGDFEAAGIVEVRTGQDRHTPFVWFSSHELTIYEKQTFLSKTRRNLQEIAFFQYDYDTFHEIMPNVPSRLSYQLLKDESLL